MAIKATGFLATLDGRLFLITTKHGLLGVESNANTIPAVCVALCYRRQEVNLPRDAFALEPMDHDDSEIADVCIVALGTGWHACSCEDCPRPVSLELIRPSQIPLPARVYARGFPDIGSSIDYDRQHISVVAYDLRGMLVGTTNRDGVFELAFEGDLPEMNGFSGSPVVLEVREKQYLLGMLHRGSAVNGKAYCLDASNIRIAVDRAIALALPPRT